METQPVNIDEIDSSLLAGIPLGYAKGNRVLPIRRHDGMLTGAVCDAKGALALREIARRHALKPNPVTLGEQELLDMINRVYATMGSAREVMDDISGEDFSSVATQFERPRDILELTEDAPIIKLLNAMLQQAVKERASDIHIEPYERELEVRFRVDGVLRRVLAPPKLIQDALLSRVKIMAGLDIAEKRLPQDGRIRLLLGGRDIDVRVSVIPTTHGERAVLRLLDRKQGLIGLREIGLSAENSDRLDGMLGRPNGILLVTGPTGSGKTTTLYAALNRIHAEQTNIITIEDPVEYELPGVGQIHVNPRIGLTFASGLRSILRQDPDVIMVGEIRDRETAEIAIQASLTGHLVLSTLHTNDSTSAVTRLIDMGVEPFLVASSLAGVLAQRLIRRLCPQCAEPYEPDEVQRAYFTHPPARLMRAVGCARCGNTGYMGREGIFEFLAIGPELIKLISSRADAATMRTEALRLGMHTLREHGLMKASEGITTLEEILRVTRTEHADISL